MEQTAKNFAIQLGALIALYVSLTSFIILSFGLINLLIPDAADNYWQLSSNTSSIRFTIASLVVFLPTYFYLTRIINKEKRQNGGKYLTITKWLIYLTLLVGGLVLLGNFVATIFTFLNGEITLRFLLKAGVLFALIGSTFTYYILDEKGYWRKREKASLIYGSAILLVSVVTIVVAITKIDSPALVREIKIDQKQVSDLQNIQWQIESYIRLNNEVPKDLINVVTENEPLTAPTGRSAYSYNITDKGFELCASFSADNPDNNLSVAKTYFDDNTLIINQDDWDYQAGEYCFQRVVKLPELEKITR